MCTPASLFDTDPEARQAAVSRALAPSTSTWSTRSSPASRRGRPTGGQVPQDLERDLAMPGGHLLHGDLEWPWAPNRSRLDTPAQQWGVQTDVASVLVCGSGSRRGGAVSGLGGHSAAQAVLASLCPVEAGPRFFPLVSRWYRSRRFTTRGISSIGRAADS